MRDLFSILRRGFSLPLLFLLPTCSSAQGSGWTTPLRINLDTLYKVASPALAVNRAGDIFVVWQHFTERPDNIKARLYFASYDGHSWSKEKPITDTNGTAWSPDVAVDTTGLPHVVWGEYATSEIYHQWFDGSKWVGPENISQDSGSSFYPRIAIDLANRIHVVWHDDTPGDWTIFYREFDGTKWSSLIALSDSLSTAGFPSIAVGVEGNAHVVFDAFTASPNDYDVFYRRNAAGAWSDLVQITNDPKESEYPDIGLKPDGTPVVIWEQVVRYDTLGPITIWAYFSSFDGSVWTNGSAIADTSQAFDPRIAIDSKGMIHTVWGVQDQLMHTTHVLYSWRGSGGWSAPVSISNSIPNPASGVIKVDSAGVCHVVYVGAANGVYYTKQIVADGVALGGTNMTPTLILKQNYPNPFNPTTTIRYALPKRSQVTLIVFNTLGQQVATLVSETQDAGIHDVRFDGSGLASGVYFYRLNAGDHVATKKLLILR